MQYEIIIIGITGSVSSNPKALLARGETLPSTITRSCPLHCCDCLSRWTLLSCPGLSELIGAFREVAGAPPPLKVTFRAHISCPGTSKTVTLLSQPSRNEIHTPRPDSHCSEHTWHCPKIYISSIGQCRETKDGSLEIPRAAAVWAWYIQPLKRARIRSWFKANADRKGCARCVKTEGD